jgi:hypothetical protein
MQEDTELPVANQLGHAIVPFDRFPRGPEGAGRNRRRRGHRAGHLFGADWRAHTEPALGATRPSDGACCATTTAVIAATSGMKTARRSHRSDEMRDS